MKFWVDVKFDFGHGIVYTNVLVAIFQGQVELQMMTPMALKKKRKKRKL